jgi:GT2 family glycosyltransferase
LQIYYKIFLEKKENEVGAIMGNGAVVGNFSKEYAQPIKVDHVRGANMSFRKEVLKQIGYFDSRFDLHHGTLFETDACFRAKKMGFDIWYDPRAIVYHYIKSDGSDAISIAHNDLLFYLKNIRTPGYEHNDIAFTLRFFSQLMFNVSLTIKRKDSGLLLKNLFEIPQTIGRSLVASCT